ncbi:MAG: PAS domain S-box protein, partial [Thiohalorhabdaceae bacterium]
MTERKRVEERVERERARNQQYLDVAQVMLLVLDTEGNVRDINPHGCMILGEDRETILGRDWFTHFLPPENREEAAEAFRRIVAGELDPAETFENEILTGEGERRLVTFRSGLLRDEQGNIEGLLASGEDVTERRKAEKERDRVIESAPTGM